MKLCLKISVAVALFAVVMTGCQNNAGGSGSTQKSGSTGPVDISGKVITAIDGSMRLIGITGGSVPLTETYKPTVSSFYMGESEVTQKQWSDVINNNGYETEPDERDGKGDDFPMYYVSWFDALVFCNKLSVREGRTPCYALDGDVDAITNPSSHIINNELDKKITCNWSANGFRLPTEAEWEYAARGGDNTTSSPVWSGTKIESEVEKYAYLNANKSCPVKSKFPNKYGMYDMSGNVWEWCWDLYIDTYDTTQTKDPTGVSIGADHIMRGASWHNNESVCTVSFRGYNRPNIAGYDGGFRVVCR